METFKADRIFPLIKYWKLVLGAYVLWVMFLLPGQWHSPLFGSIWAWLSLLTTPATHTAAFVFIAPAPWVISQRLRSPWGFVVGLVASLIVSLLVAAALPALDGWLLSHTGAKFNLRRILFLYISLVGPGLLVIGGLIASRVRSDALRVASEAEALIAKNRLLQSQIHPHVLFNALNGLAELIHNDRKEAETAVRHLSDLLRRLLAASEHTTLPLREERRIVTDYLGVEAIRLGDRLKVSWDWDDRLDGLEIPPLLLQPLVENAIKHGVAPARGGGELIIRAQIAGEDLHLEVWNTGNPLIESKKASGIGVRNLASRLHYNYGDDAALTLETSAGGTLASITIHGSQVGWSDESVEGSHSR